MRKLRGMYRVVMLCIVAVLLFTLPVTMVGDNGGNTPISLGVDVHGWSNVIVRVTNRSSYAVRLWEDRNSWGWPNISFCVVTSDGIVRPITRKKAKFSKNGPTFYSVAAGETKTIELDLTDGWWQGFDEEMLRHSPLAVSAILHIDPSTEATELHVWTGTAISPWTNHVGQ